MVFKKEHSLFLSTLFCIGLFNACTQTQVYAIPVNLLPSPSEGIKYPINIACECDYSLYVDGKYAQQVNTEVNIIESVEYGHPGWNATKKFYPIIYDKSPKIIAFTGVGSQFPGFLNGFVMDMNNGEDYTKYQEWKCKDFSSTVTKVPPSNWFTYDYDDNDWAMSASYGKNYQNNSFQLFERERDGISLEAEWLWTSNNAISNIYCRKKNENVKTIPVVLTTVPVQTSAPTHVSKTIHPTIVQTSAPTHVQTSAPHSVQTSAPHPVQTSAPHPVQTSAPHPVHTSAPHSVQTSAPTHVQTSAPTHVSTTIHPTVVQTSAPSVVQTHAPTHVQTSAPHPVHTSAPHPVQTSAPHPVHTSAPHPVHTSAPHPVQTSAPHPVQTSAPHPVHTSAPHPVHTSAPHPVQTSAPHPVHTSAPTHVSKTIHPTIVQTHAPTHVQTSAPHSVQTSAPHPVQTSAPHPVHTSAPTHVSKTIHPTIVQTHAPTHVQTPAPHSVQTHAPTHVQTSAPTHVSTTIHPTIVQTSAPHPVSTTIHPTTVSTTIHPTMVTAPPTNYNIVISPHIKIIIQNVKYSRKRSYEHIDNLFRKLKNYNDDYTIYKQLLLTRYHIRKHYTIILHDIRKLLYSTNIHHDNTAQTPHFVISMQKLDNSIKRIEQSIHFIKGNHKYILLNILHKLKLQYQTDTQRLLHKLNNDFN